MEVKLIQILKELITKYSVVAWIGSWIRKMTLMKTIEKAK